jgi:hypothetical protein
VNNLVADGEDIIKSPCHAGELLKNPSFYWTTLAAGAALGAGFALDEPARSEFRHISHKDSSHLQSWGSAALWGSTGALYLYGLTVDDTRAREYALTGLLSTGASVRSRAPASEQRALAAGTTELFLHMHALHAAGPSRYRVFPVVVNHGFGLGVSATF